MATKPKSDAFAAIHSAAAALHDIGAISKATMREYDALCVTPPPAYTAEDVARIRKQVSVSQAVLAVYLNTSTSTVQKWENGQKNPSGMAARLLQVVQKHGLSVLACA